MGVRGYGATKEEAFAEAARALSALTTDLDAVEPKEAVPIRVEAGDDDQLLYAFLDALVFEMATRHMVFRDFDVAIDDGKLEATVRGEPWDDQRHPAGVEVKGPTFTALHVGRTEDGRFVAQAVVDV